MHAFVKELKESFFAEKDRFILWLPVLFGLGIGIYFLLPFEPSVWVTIFVVELFLALLYVWRYNPVKYTIVGCLLIVSLGFSNIQIRSIYQSKFIQAPKEQKELTYLKGQILKIDNNAKGKVRLLLTEVSDFDEKRKGLYKITLNSKEKKLMEGQCVEMVATIMSPMLPVLPDSYQFNRKDFYEGISAVGYANSSVYTVDCETSLSLSQTFYVLINYIRKKIVSNVFQELPKDEAAITSAILAGSKDAISQDLYKQYRDSGLAHFLSISGLHMGMIATLAFFTIRLLISLVPRFALRYNSKQSAAVFAIFISFIYLLISGCEIPVQRAFIMTFVVLLGVLFSRRAISIRMLSIAAFVVLLVSPYALVSASFQMSFAAVLMLIAFYERFSLPIQKFVQGKNIFKIILAYTIGLLVSDFIASIATLPFVIYHFNKISIYTALGNLLAGPVIGFIIMPFVLISLFLMPFNLYAIPLKVVGFGVGLLNDITAYVARLPNAGYPVLSMPFFGLSLIVVGGLWLCIWQQKWRLWGIVPIVLGVLSFVFVSRPDFIYSADGKTIAVKDNFENMLIMPFGRQDFIKQIWLEKMATDNINDEQMKNLKKIYKGKLTDKQWVDLECENKKCVYKNKIIWDNNGAISVDGKKIDVEKSNGGVIYIKEHENKHQTIRSAIGYRLWN